MQTEKEIWNAQSLYKVLELADIVEKAENIHIIWESDGTAGEMDVCCPLINADAEGILHVYSATKEQSFNFLANGCSFEPIENPMRSFGLCGKARKCYFVIES